MSNEREDKKILVKDKKILFYEGVKKLKRELDK
jgi:hypothetical protein